MCRWKSLPWCGHPHQLCGAGLPPLCRTRSCSRALAWGVPPGCRGPLWCCWRGFFNAFCPSAPRSCPWVKTSLYLFILADSMPMCPGRETGAARSQPLPGCCCYREAALGSVLETSPTPGCSLQPGCLKGSTAHPCLKGPTAARGPRRGRQPCQPLQQPRGKRCTKLGPAQSPGWLHCLPCLCLPQLPLCRRRAGEQPRATGEM